MINILWKMLENKLCREGGGAWMEWLTENKPTSCDWGWAWQKMLTAAYYLDTQIHQNFPIYKLWKIIGVGIWPISMEYNSLPRGLNVIHTIPLMAEYSVFAPYYHWIKSPPPFFLSCSSSMKNYLIWFDERWFEMVYI